MSDLDEAKTALAELESDPSETHLIGNIVDEISDPDAFNYLIENLQPYRSEFFEDTDALLSLFRYAIGAGVKVPKIEFQKLSEWLESGLKDHDIYGKSTVCVEMAAMYRKETYPDDNDLSNIEDAELVKHWVDLAVEYADDADEFLNIIEAVSEPHQGLYLGDKSWGKELLEQIVSKTDSDVSKKVAASGKKLLD